jgi:hypothetical protein
MRPTRSEAQLDLELARAVELEYDMIKTYVRLPVAYQQAVVQAAHRAGIPLSSHYLYPAANIGMDGMDGMEHMGATNRLGYSHTVSRTGRSYQDMVALFVRSGMSLTPTLFSSSVLYADDKSLVTDERTKVLFPQWEYDRLVADAAAASEPANAYQRRVLANNVETVARIHRSGFVVNGTDAPLDRIGVATHMNLRAMVTFGLTPYEALTTATRNSARRLGLEGRIGTLTPGAYADVSLVSGDPLTDIKARGRGAERHGRWGASLGGRSARAVPEPADRRGGEQGRPGQCVGRKEALVAPAGVVRPHLLRRLTSGPGRGGCRLRTSSTRYEGDIARNHPADARTISPRESA